MRLLFADTFFWTALADPADQWHDFVAKYESKLAPDTLVVTTEEVLIEFATQLGSRSTLLRHAATLFVEDILSNSDVEVVEQSHQSFTKGFELFAARPDKLYSLVDCISMVTMKQRGIDEALTYHRHFEQEGFRAVFR